MSITLGDLNNTSDQTMTDLRTFLIFALPDLDPKDIVQGQINRVAPPLNDDYVVFTPTWRKRFSTNIDTFADVQFTANVAGNYMNVVAVKFGSIQLGSALLGANITTTTIIKTQVSGTPGGVGVYTLSNQLNVPNQTFAAGVRSLLAPGQVDVQVDFHGPQQEDHAQLVSTLFRSDIACDIFNKLGHGVSPLWADDPRQVPFINEQQQYEYRWILDAHLQVNAAVALSQEFAAALAINLVDVEVYYPN